MSVLREFQAGFARGLLDPCTTLCERHGPGFAVYQNTVMKGLVDVLRANYPAVVNLLGDAWFDALALAYVREHLPVQPALSLYGETFPRFMAASHHAEPYLSAVAQLDRLWTEAHFAGDAVPLKAAQLALLSPEQLAALRLRLHPAARLACVEYSAVTLWRHARQRQHAVLEVEDRCEAVLLTRPHGAVQVLPLSLPGYALLQHVQSGLTLGEAAAAVLAEQPVDLAGLLATLLHAGAFGEVHVRRGA